MQNILSLSSPSTLPSQSAWKGLAPTCFFFSLSLSNMDPNWQSSVTWAKCLNHWKADVSSSSLTLPDVPDDIIFYMEILHITALHWIWMFFAVSHVTLAAQWVDSFVTGDPLFIHLIDAVQFFCMQINCCTIKRPSVLLVCNLHNISELYL